MLSGGSSLFTTPNTPAPLTSWPPLQSQAPTRESVTTAAQSGCFNISVAFPVSSFCATRADGLYLQSGGPVMLYRCLQGKLLVTRCHIGSEHSSAVSIVLPVSYVLSTIVFMLSVAWLISTELLTIKSIFFLQYWLLLFCFTCASKSVKAASINQIKEADWVTRVSTNMLKSFILACGDLFGVKSCMLVHCFILNTFLFWRYIRCSVGNWRQNIIPTNSIWDSKPDTVLV